MGGLPDKLLEQKEIVQGYVLDEVYNKMESGEAWIAPYYAGDYFFMRNVNEDLGFFYPEETNIFVDCLCIPKGAPNKDIAALFINYMLSETPAIETAEFICFASPNAAVYENEEYQAYMGEEAMAVLYPEDFDMQAEMEKNAFRNLDPKTNELIASLWEQLKISGGMPTHIYVISVLLALSLLGFVLWRAVVRKRQSRWW